jgi:hypothetical protein
MIKHAVTMTYPNTIGDICVQFGAVALYSFIRPFRYSTQAFIVRRQSDNETQTTNYDGEEVSASAETFCAGTNGFITTLFDQIGANNATQTTATAQTQIVTNGQYVRSGNNFTPPQSTPPHPNHDTINDCLTVSGFPASTEYWALWADFTGVWVRKIKTPVSGSMSLIMGKNNAVGVNDFFFLAYFPISTDMNAVSAALRPYLLRFLPYLTAQDLVIFKMVNVNTGLQFNVSANTTFTLKSKLGTSTFSGSGTVPIPITGSSFTPFDLLIITASNLANVQVVSRNTSQPENEQPQKGRYMFENMPDFRGDFSRLRGSYYLVPTQGAFLTINNLFVDAELFFANSSSTLLQIFTITRSSIFGILPNIGSLYPNLVSLPLFSSELTELDPAFVMPAGITNFIIQTANLPTSAINTILIAADTAWGTAPPIRTLNLSGTGNAAPTGPGITAKNNLIAKGHIIITN